MGNLERKTFPEPTTTRSQMIKIVVAGVSAVTLANCLPEAQCASTKAIFVCPYCELKVEHAWYDYKIVRCPACKKWVSIQEKALAIADMVVSTGGNMIPFLGPANDFRK